MNRIIKLFTVPIWMVIAKMYPEKYARKIGVKFGENLKIYGSSYSMFGTEPWLINIGCDVHITLDVKFVCHDGGTLIFRKHTPDLEITKPINIGNNVYIGVRTLILPGVTIGDNCIIGAGSIITKDIPANSVAAGVPAKVIKNTDEYLKKIKKESLHIGHLGKKEKAKELKNIYDIS
jgi:acetyltransferase-like isoleucine patch superfamily enzyme